MVDRRRMALRRRITSSCYVLVNHEPSGGALDGRGRFGSVAYLELIDEDGDGIELIVRVRRVSHGEQCG